jgi:hypothetical protein
MNRNWEGRTVRFNECLFVSFITINVILPGDIYNLKKILFVLILFFNLPSFISAIRRVEYQYVLFFGFIFPLGLISYSTILTGDLAVSFTRSFAAFLFLLLVIIREKRMDIERIVIGAVKFIVVMTLVVVLLDILRITNINSSWLNELFHRFNLGIMGKSVDFPLYYKVFFKTSPLVVFLLFRSIHKTDFLWLILSMLTLVLSGTRANALFALIFMTLYFLFYANRKWIRTKYLALFIGMSMVIIFGSIFVSILVGIVINRGAVSDIVRAGHVQGLLALVYKQPWIVFFGSGMGSYFYSYGANAMVSSIEWSFLDLWRQMGIVFFSFYLLFIFIPVFKRDLAPYKRFAYLTYLCIAATNPLLFSSTFYLAIYIIYDDFYTRKEDLDGYSTRRDSIGDI